MSVYSNWYPHDFDAGNDPRIIKLEMIHGLEGYGLYHRILEHMGTAENHALFSEEINFIAKRCFSSIEKPATVFLELGLFFELKCGRLTSKSLCKRLKVLDEKRARRVIAGRKGGKAKASKATSSARAKLQVPLEQSRKQKPSETLALHYITVQKSTEEKNTKKYRPRACADRYDWINKDLWTEWVDFKIKIKASTTERAMTDNIKKLQQFGTENANAVIAQSLDRGWRSFYALKGDHNQGSTKHNQPHLSKEEGARERNRETLRVIREEEGY